MPTSAGGEQRSVVAWAAQKIAEQRNGGPFKVDFVPDEIEREAPAIDLIGRDARGTICLEDTLIEAYEGQVIDNRRANQMQSLLAERFGHGLEPPGQYTLGLNTGDLARLRRKDVASTVDALETWVRAQDLPVPTLPPLRVPNHVVSGPEDVPIRVTLFRMRCSPEEDGDVRFALMRDSTIEEKRASRIRKALSDKAPKLEAARISNSKTVLVLEMNDYVLSNRWEVSRIFYSVAQSVEVPLPDVVIIVDTSAGEGAWVEYTVNFDDWWSDAALDQFSSGF